MDGVALIMPTPLAAAQSPSSAYGVRAGPRRGLSREEAAAYIGVSPSMFDFLVSEGKMPKPRRIPSRNPDARRRRTVWDIRALDRAFDELPGEDDANPFDEDMD